MSIGKIENNYKIMFKNLVFNFLMENMVRTIKMFKCLFNFDLTKKKHKLFINLCFFIIM